MEALLNVFFTADTNGNYTFEILLSGVVSILNPLKLNAEIITGNAPIGNQFAVASDSTSAVNGMSVRHYGFRILGAAANVSTGTSFSIRIGITIDGLMMRPQLWRQAVRKITKLSAWRRRPAQLV